uniref:Fucose mutarotase n=1 Tax=Oryctolagus cuniculus TaxID=9986 RepID=A0A5F9CS16_RABIT
CPALPSPQTLFRPKAQGLSPWLRRGQPHPGPRTPVQFPPSQSRSRGAPGVRGQHPEWAGEGGTPQQADTGRARVRSGAGEAWGLKGWGTEAPPSPTPGAGAWRGPRGLEALGARRGGPWPGSILPVRPRPALPEAPPPGAPAHFRPRHARHRLRPRHALPGWPRPWWRSRASRAAVPELLYALARMGHGDEIVLADVNFPTSSVCRSGPVEIRADGLRVPQLLEAVLQLLPLDTYVPSPAAVMELEPSDMERGLQTPVWQDYESILSRAGCTKALAKIERFEFYERARKAFAVVATGETALYGNLILKKGVLALDSLS